MKIGSLFSGYGGLDLGVQATLGGDIVWHCENEDAPSRILAHHWPDTPNLGDITKVHWDHVQPVDVITAGWPCQPFSLAGKRKGSDDERALWPEVARAVRMVRPGLVVLENVSAVVAAGELARAADSLAAIGYDMRWTCLRASDAGAAHQRERFFGIAYPKGEQVGSAGLPRPRPRRVPSDTGGEAVGLRTGLRQGDPAGIRGRRPYDDTPSTAADAAGIRSRPLWPAGDGPRLPRGPRRASEQPPPDTAGNTRRLTHRDDVATDWGPYELAIRRAERAFGRPAPDPTEPGPRGGQRLSPRFVEWHMGLPPGWVTDVPGITRTDQLRALGNGVVPQQAAMALRWLLSIDEAVA